MKFEQRFYCTRQFLIFKQQVLIFEQIFEQNSVWKFWKKSHASWITPIYSDFSKIWCWKILFICVITSFLDMLKLEKSVRFDSADWNSNIQFHRPFFCQLEIFPVIDYVRTVKNPARCFSARSKSILSKWINSQGVEIEFLSWNHYRETKNFQNNAHQETLYNWKLNSNMFQNFTSVSKMF